MNFRAGPALSDVLRPWSRLVSSALVFLLVFPLLLAGCGKGDFFDKPRTLRLSGAVHGGQQPVGASVIQIYAVGTTGDGSAATPLLTQPVTTSDGSGDSTNSNANASNGYNSYPAGAFSTPDAIACPTQASEIYITAIGGNPGLGGSVNNPNLALLAVLGPCSDFGATSFVNINELTTVASVAPLNGFMSSYSALGSGTADAAAFVAQLGLVAEYTDISAGVVPGPMLPSGYYASSVEITTLANIVAGCVNSNGGVAGDGSSCGDLFAAVVPGGVTAPTDTIGAMLDIIKYPTNNVCSIYDLGPAKGPFEPVLPACPPDWELPILPIAATPAILPATGNYVGPQTVTITDATPGTTIYYTTDGTAPSATSATASPYTVPFVVSASAKVEAIAVETGYEASLIATASYVIAPASTPVSLAFIQQPSNTATGYAIAPPVSVAIEDVNGNIVTNSTSPVTISIATNPPAGSTTPGTLSGTLTAIPSNGIATFLNPSIDAIANGYQLLATSPGLNPATSNAFNITPYPITIAPASELVGVGSTLPGSFTLGQPAPAGGLTVNLASSSAAVSIAPSSVTLSGGQTVGSFTYTGISTGTSTLSASATNYLTGTSVVTATNALISLGQLPVVAPGQTSQLALSLGVVAPAPGVTVSFTSTSASSTNGVPNPACATVTPSVFIPTMFKIAAENPMVTATTTGTALITATAPGYAPAVRTVSCSLTASFPASTTIPLTAANPVTLTISAPAPTGGLTFTLSSDNPNIATVPASITVPQGSTTVSVPVTGVSFGTTTVRADSPGVPEATTSVTVQAAITMPTVTTGTNEYVPANVFLGATATPPTTVTITSNNPALALLSTSPTMAGASSITLSNISNSVPTFYVQGQGTVGATTLTISAPGYMSGTGTAVVDPVGVVFFSGLNIATTTIAAPSTLTLATAILDPNTLAVLGYNGLPNPGSPAYSIAVTSTSTPSGVGTITTSPVNFASGGTGRATTSFNPLVAGTATIALGSQPPGFYATSSTGTYLSGTAVVTADTGIPNITVNVPATGVGLQVPATMTLGAAPGSPVNVTLTSTSNALLSLSPTATGSASITLVNVSTATPQTFYVQGEGVGTATLAVTAAGYNPSNSSITVDQSGIVFGDGYTTSGFTTTSSSTPTTLTLLTAILDPQTLAIACPTPYGSPVCGYALNPGVSASIRLGNGTPATGTLSGEGAGSFTTVVIGSNGSGSTDFQPINVGTTTLTLGGQPAGFNATTSPVGYLSQTATVTGPAISVANATTGAGLYVKGSAGFSTPTTQPVTVTVSIASPGIATISASPTAVGTQSLTFTNVSSALPAFYIQGQSVGTTTLNIYASGYNSASATVTVDPAGIVFYEGSVSSTFSTTTFSSPRVISLATAILDPVTLAVINPNPSPSLGNPPCPIGGVSSCYYPLNPGMSLSIPVTSSAAAVGVITNGTVTFPAGSNGLVTTAFEPVTAGTSTIALGAQPAGFNATSSAGFLSGTATVTSPPVYVTVNNITTGVGLMVPAVPTLSAATPSPTTVTVTSSNPAVALLSTSASVVGSASLTFTGVTTSIPLFYVQGQTQGTSALTVALSGYTAGTSTITVDPSGVVFYQGTANSTFSTTTFSSPTTINLATAILDPAALTVLCPGGNAVCYYPLNPGTSLSVPVTSATTSVGTIVTSPVIFQPGSAGLASTAFQPVGVGTSALSLTQPPGFTTTTSAGYANGTATVTGPAINVYPTSITTGVDLYVGGSVSLGVAPPSPVTVTIASSTPSVATLSTDTVTPGIATISFNGVGGTSGLTYYVQGQSVGTTTLTVSAAGYTTATVTVTVDPSGLVFYDVPTTPTFTTTSFSPPATLTVVTAILDPKSGAVVNQPCYLGVPCCSPYEVSCYFPINPGAGPFSINVTSTPTSVGTITNGTVTFPVGSSGLQTTSFQPVSPGSAVIALGTQPGPFTATSSTPGYLTEVATVTGPCMNVSNALTGAGFYVNGTASLGVAPPSGSVPVSLTSSDPTKVLLSTASGVGGSTSITYSSVAGAVPTFYIQGQSVGTTTVTASAPGYCTGTATVTVDPPSVVFFNQYYNGFQYTGATFSTTTFSPQTNVYLATAILDPVSLAVVGTVFPLNPGNTPTFSLSSSSATIGTIQSPVTFPAGSGGIVSTLFQPVNVGNTTLAVTEPAGFSTTSSTTSGYLNGTATVTGPTINISAPNTGAGVYVSGNASLAVAPPSPVTVTITSSNPAIALLSANAGTVGSPSLTFNNITGSVPTFYVQGLTVGNVTLTAVATGYTTTSATVAVDPVGIVFQGGLSISTTTFSPATQISVSDALLDPVTYTVLSTGLPFNPNYGPYTIALNSTVPSVGTVTPSVTFPAASNGTATATFTPVNVGSTTISLGTQPAGFTTTLSSGTYLNGSATVTGPTINVPNPTTGAGQYIATSASLAQAPLAGVTVTITSSNSAVALLSTSPTTPGTASGGTSTITFNNITGTAIPAFYVQGQAVGATTLTISAQGYTTGTGTITVDPSGIVFYQGSNSSTLATTTFAAPSSLTLATAILNPGTLSVLNYSGIPNPGSSLSIPVTLGTSGVGTVTSPVTFAAGANTASAVFNPVGTGTTSINLGTQPPGFSATTSTPGYLSGTITVSAPNVTLNVPAASTLGAGLTGTGTFALGATPPSPVNVTLTSANPAVALLSASSNTVGSASITFTNVSNTSPITFYVQGQAVGTAALYVAAAGFSGGGTITVNASGFGFTTTPTFTTTTLSGNTTLTVTTLILNPSTLAVLGSGSPLNPGSSVSLAVTSANSLVGTILTSPVTIAAGSATAVTSFQPVGGGTSLIALGAQPAGFSTPSQASYVQGTATVTAPAINLDTANLGAGAPITTGVNLTYGNSYSYISLAVTPSGATTITMTSSNPTVATLGTGETAAAVGTASIQFTGVTSTALQYFNVQGHSVGTATITVSAPGFATTTFTVTVDPSAFGFNGAPTFSTTTLSANTIVTVSTLVLNPGNLTQYAAGLPLNPGTATIMVPVTSSNSSVGTILTSPVAFSGGMATTQTTFQPLSAGTTTIAIGTEPAGFSTPSSAANVQGTATVTSFGINVPASQTTGVSLTDGGLSFSLGAAPLSGVPVTLTSSNPAVATLAYESAPVAPGTASITYPLVSGTASQFFNIQGQSVGTSTITVSAPGYTTATFTVTVDPSGFGFSAAPTFTTSTLSGNTTLTVATLVLNPGSLTVLSSGLPLNPGTGSISVPVTSSNTAAGTITTSPVVFSAGSSTAPTAFHPVGAGTATIAIGTEPSGFSTPSTTANVQGTATVSSFGISVPPNQTVGVSLTDGSLSVSLGATPPGAVTITLTSSNAPVATLGVGPTGGTAGTASITLTGVTSTAAQSFNIQGQIQGTSTITVSAPGYITATFTVTVNPTSTTTAYHEVDGLTFSVLNADGTSSAPSSVSHEADGLTFSVLNADGTSVAPSSVSHEADSLTFSVLNADGTSVAPSSVSHEADSLTFSVLNADGTSVAPSSVSHEADSLTFSVLNADGTSVAPSSVSHEADSLTFSVLNADGTSVAPSSVSHEADSLTFSVQNTAPGVASVSEPPATRDSFDKSLSPASVSSRRVASTGAAQPDSVRRNPPPRSSVFSLVVDRLLRRHPRPRAGPPFVVQVAASPPGKTVRSGSADPAHAKPT